MAINRTREPAAMCAFCDGPMPPPARTGRPAVFCSSRCRKAAHEARRTHEPGAFEVKVVEKAVAEHHDLAECVARVVASPAACRNVLRALTRAAADGTLANDPRWRPTQAAAQALVAALATPRGRFAPPGWPRR